MYRLRSKYVDQKVWPRRDETLRGFLLLNVLSRRSEGLSVERMRVRKLDEHGDMTFGAGRKNYLIDSAEAVAQCVLTRLRLIEGEWYIDTKEGTPYMSKIFGRGTESSSVLALQQRVLDSPGVRRIVSIGAVHDAESRKAAISITIETDYGVTTINA